MCDSTQLRNRFIQHVYKFALKKNIKTVWIFYRLRFPQYKELIHDLKRNRQIRTNTHCTESTDEFT